MSFKKIEYPIKEVITRKYARDCIHKKIKTNQFKFLKRFIEMSAKIKLNSIKKEIIADIRLKYNKFIYSQSIYDFIYDNLYLFRSEADREKFFANKDLIDLFSLCLLDFFQKFYYNSNSILYERQINKIKSTGKPLYTDRYIYYDRYFLDYIRNKKANAPRWDINLGKNCNPREKNENYRN